MYVFDHPVDHTLPEWFWDSEALVWNELADPATTVQYLTQLFENPASLLAPYSDAQCNQGLWFLGSNACSSHMFALNHGGVPMPDRLRCAGAMGTLFEQLFAVRCSPHLSHRDEPGANPLNSVCYMWWDVLPVDASFPQMADTLLGVMIRSLALDSVACQESALHGLGHWRGDESHVRQTIDDFLARSPDLRPDLRQYALSARGGCVQ